MMLGSCLFKFARWQHSAMGRGASFDILAIVGKNINASTRISTPLHILLTQYVQRRRN